MANDCGQHGERDIVQSTDAYVAHREIEEDIHARARFSDAVQA